MTLHRGGWALLGSIALASVLSCTITSTSPPSATDYFSPQEIRTATAYAQGRQLLYVGRLCLTALVLSFVALSRTGRDLATGVARLARGRWWVELLLIGAVVLLLQRATTFPLAFYGGFIRERAYHLTRYTALAWLADYGKGLVLTLLLLSVAALAVYSMMRRWPRRWILPAWLAVVLLSVVLTTLHPLLIDPLFHELRPVDDPRIRSQVRELAQRAGLEVDRVLRVDASRRTRKMNAYFTGFSGSRRVVLYDTLLVGADPREVDLVLAHELGHWKHRHIQKGLAMGTLGSLVALLALAWGLGRAAARGGWGFTDPARPASLPLALLIVFGLNILSSPLQLAVSRHFERQADLASLRLTDDPDGFIATELRLARTNLSDPEPSDLVVALTYTHPPVLARIQQAELYRTLSERRGSDSREDRPR